MTRESTYQERALAFKREFEAGAKRHEEGLANGTVWAVGTPTHHGLSGAMKAVWRTPGAYEPESWTVRCSDGWDAGFSSEKAALDFIAAHPVPTFVDFVRATLGTSNWVVARRTPRILSRYGDDVLCLTAACFNEIKNAYRAGVTCA